MDAIICVDAARQIIVFNPAAERMFGYLADEVVGRTVDAVLLDDVDRFFHAESDHHLLRSGAKTPPVEYLSELTGRRKDGAEFPVEAAFSRVGPPGEEQFTAVVRDITERRRTERAITETEARQRAFLRDVLFSVTEGRLRLVDSRAELPLPLGPIGEAVPLRLPSLREVRDRVRDTAMEQGLSVERAFDLVTAAGEAMINAVQHGGGEATARICGSPGRVQVWIEDRGRGISVTDLPKATLLKGHSGGDSFGHGFFMMLRTADVVYLLTGPSGTTVVIEQSAVPNEPPWLKGL
jgi:PAS domain S-box-containing protein